MRLLLIERHPDDVERIDLELRRFGFQPEIERVDSLVGLAEALARGGWSAVISDDDLRGFDADDALRAIRDNDNDLPFIVVATALGEERAVDLIRRGANDCVTTAHLGRLALVLKRELRDVQLREERRSLFTALRRSEERYRRLFDRTPVGVALTTPGGIAVAANEQFASIFGYDRDELMGNMLSDFIDTRFVDGERAAAQTLRHMRPDGTVVRASVSVAPIVSDDFVVEQFVWLAQDVTEAHEQQAELERRALQQAIVANLGQSALAGTEIDELLAGAAAAVESILDADRCDILEAIDGSFRVAATSAESARDSLASGAAALAERTLAAGGIMTIDDVSVDSRVTEASTLLERGVHSVVAVSIATGSTPWGVLEVSSAAPRHFTSADAGFLLSVATVVAQALERDRLDRRLMLDAAKQSAIAELSRIALRSVDEAIENVCGLLRDVLHPDCAAYYEHVGEGRLRLVAGYGSGHLPAEIDYFDHTAETIALERDELMILNSYGESQPRSSRDMHQSSTIRGVAVPVSSASGLFGVLTSHCENPRLVSGSDIEFVQSLANLLAEGIERERARRALARSEERYREVVEGASEVIFTLSTDGLFTSLNAAFGETTGWRPADWLGRPFSDLISVEDREAMKEYFEQIVRTQRVVSSNVRVLGRTQVVLFDVTSFPKVVEGSTTAVYGFARDITLAHRVEMERQELTRSLQLLLGSTVEGILTVDLEGRCTMSNRAAARILGRSPEELDGADVHMLLHGSAHGECPLSDIMRGSSVRAAASDIFLRGDGRPVPVEYSAAPVIDDGVVVAIVVSFSDVTERRKLEAKLEQADRLASLGRLAATIAHEFNNVLMGISPFVEVIRRGRNIETSLDHISRAVARGKRITSDILRFTQPAEPSRTVIDMTLWIDQILIEARSLMPPSCEIDAFVAPGLRIHGDANQLQQIFTNLILNARDAMPGGGRLTITARREPVDARFPFGAVDRPETKAHIVVRDTGEGMSADVMRHIFEPLFTTKGTGTGLGLPVTHQVVHRHGGDIFVESAPGQGTAFHIFLPLATATQSVAHADDERVEPPSRPHSILLVEDDAAVAAGIATLLEFEGLRVEIAPTGAEAIAAVERERPDALVLDVGLPDMEGTTVYSRIAASHPDLPVVFSTGHADRARLAHFLRKPTVACLLKPYEADELLGALRDVMDARSK